MSTSANVTYFGVYRDGRMVGEHRHNALCKPKDWKMEMAAYVPAEEFTVIARWPDEDEADHFSDPMPLADFLKGSHFVWPAT